MGNTNSQISSSSCSQTLTSIDNIEIVKLTERYVELQDTVSQETWSTEDKKNTIYRFGNNGTLTLKLVGSKNNNLLLKRETVVGAMVHELRAIKKTQTNATISQYLLPARILSEQPPIVVMPDAQGGNVEIFMNRFRKRPPSDKEDDKFIEDKEKDFDKLVLDCIRNVIKIVSELRKQGFYYFNLRPENIFVLNSCKNNVGERCVDHTPSCLVRLGDYASLSWFPKHTLRQLQKKKSPMSCTCLTACIWIVRER